MLIKIKKAHELKSSEITPQKHYLNRRQFLKTSAMGSAFIAASTLFSINNAHAQNKNKKLIARKSKYSTTEKQTPYDDVTTYNNFYEFGTDKGDPAKNSENFKPSPWTISIEGEAQNLAHFHLEDFIKPYALEERIYRHRCVEGWSMVIPWIGFPLSEIIKKAKPTSKAKYLEFVTLLDPKQMEGQNRAVLEWPYLEGLRMDEAMHPLTILAVGLYGEVLLNQNGAPLRLVVPWKYGFKSIKSIVKIRFVEKQPINTWNKSAPQEYGFYSNVNPEVDHPRWSQARERRIGEFLKRPSLLFNGYDEVSSLYAGMDLKKYF